MGRTWTVVAVLGALVGPAAAQQPTPPVPPTPVPVQPAPPELSAADAYRQGQEAAARGDLAGAIAMLARALELEPASWEYKLALADAERQAGQCEQALPRYKELLATEGADRERAAAGARQCPNAVVLEVPAPAPAPAPPPPAPPPQIIEREGPPSLLNGALLAGAGALFGASIGFYFAGESSEGDADDARSFADHERISNRADRQKVAAAVLFAGAIGLGGYAIYRIKFQSERAEVAVTPTATGGAMVVRGTW